MTKEELKAWQELVNEVLADEGIQITFETLDW